MESVALFRVRGASLSKLPLYARAFSTTRMMASWPRFDLGKPSSFPSRLSNGSVGVSIGLPWNLNRHDKFLADCGNAYKGQTHSDDADEEPLKSLLSLVLRPTSTVTSTKNEALKLVVGEKYNEAERHMKHLCDGDDADVAYEARLAHLQILIHLDEYKKALEFLEKKNNFPPSKAFDARLCLYKGLVHTMLGKDVKAEEWWNKYLKSLGNVNVNDKLESASCRNTNSESFLTSGEGLLKPLLSLKPAKAEKGSLFFKIYPTKNMAIKDAVNGKYEAAENRMRELCKVVTIPEEALEAQMAYVQILIHLDKYEEALKRLIDNQNLFSQSDARPCLYKAIGLTVLGNHEDAKICWKAFIKIKGLPRPQ